MRRLRQSIGRFRRTLVLLSIVLWSGCSSLPVKQQATVGLQASELALETAHDIERSLCFTIPTTESGGHCTNPNAAATKLTDALHQRLADLFSHAFDVEIKAATALIAWHAGDPAPTDVAGYQKDIQAILALVQQLVGSQSQPLIAKVQLAVDEGAKTATALGVK